MLKDGMTLSGHRFVIVDFIEVMFWENVFSVRVIFAAAPPLPLNGAFHTSINKSLWL